MSVRILVVDDEPDVEHLIRQRFRKRIRAEELSFAFAHDGVEALNVLEEDDSIDVVMSDINMPRMDGLTLLRHIGELNRLLKVVIVSAYGDMENIRTAMNRGAFDFITKPIDFTDLDLTLAKTQQELIRLKEAVASVRELDVLRRDLDLARNIQLSFVPDLSRVRTDTVAVDALMKPAREVGGDFYDFFPLDTGRYGLAIGDVAGKGLGAALFMAVTRTLLRATALSIGDPGQCLSRVNTVLHAEAPSNMFVTALYGVIDENARTLTYAVAGHNAPVLVPASGKPRLLDGVRGPALCLMGTMNYQTNTVRLDEEEVLLFYTDGVTESVDSNGERFEEARLLDTIESAPSHHPTKLLEAVDQAVRTFAGGGQFDDITMLGIGCRLQEEITRA